MTKRILFIVLVLVMLVDVLPANIINAESAATKHTHSDAHQCSEKCPGGTVTWTAWGKTNGDNTSLPATSGHYYLEDNVALLAAWDVAAGNDITICLNGYHIRSKTNARVGYVYGKLTISDCAAYEQDGQYISGSVAGSQAADGSVFGVRRGGTLILQSGKLTGGKAGGNSGGGAVYLQKGTTAGPGGVMHMYGGEVSGNEGNHGGAISLGGADASCAYAAFYMYGGTITGNTARGNGGGIHGENRSTVEFHGGSITGNTAAGTGKAVNIDGKRTMVSASGSVRLDGMNFSDAQNAGLKVNGITVGTEIAMTTAATDPSKIISLTSGGRQESWNMNWVIINGEQVSLVEGVLKVGHYHGTTKFEAWSGTSSHNTLPTGRKNFYLTNPITRNADGTAGGGAITIASGATQRMCLNGHTITHRKAAERLYNIRGTFYLEDCTAYTDSEGNYVSGGITYGGATPSTRTFGALFSVQRGGTMTMTGGQIYGLNSAARSSHDGAAVYVQGAQTNAKAVFNMQGGQIHSNTSNANGAAIRLTRASSNAATENFSEVNISGGKIWGNTSAANGSAIAMTGDILNITGGTVEGNRAETGAVYVAGDVKFSMSGSPVIAENNGGNLYLADNVTINLGALDTGARIGVAASHGGRAITDVQHNDVTSHFFSDTGEGKISFRNNCVFLSAAHEHGIDGSAGDMGWTKWTCETSLPTEAGNYYLVKDVQLEKAASIGAEVNICLNGKTVTAASGARVFTVAAGGQLTITDCGITCGTVTGGNNSYGAAVNVNRKGVFNLYKGIITGNAAVKDGGAVYIQGSRGAQNGGVFHMYSGEISGNTAKRGGAVAIADNAGIGKPGRFNMLGGTVTGNEAANGGGIYTYAGAVLDLSGGQITGNTATTAAGGVYVHADAGNVNLSGSIVIKHNKLGQQASNVYLLGSAKLNGKGLTSHGAIFVSAATADRAITTAAPETSMAAFTSDSAYRMLTYRDGAVYLETSDAHVHCVCFSKTEGCDHAKAKWQAWESATSLPTASGNYYLLADVVLKNWGSVPADQNVNLCLNGKRVTAPENSRILLVMANGKLKLTDCTGSGKLTGGKCAFGGAININRGATVDLYGGILTGNEGTGGKNNGLGGAVYIQAGKIGEAGGIFNMYGGAVTNNTGYDGGAICAATGTEADAVPAQINIYGGEISGNASANRGGAIYAGKHSVLNIKNGTYSGNVSGNCGGVIYADTTEATVAGGKFTGNTSAKNGGAIYGVASTVKMVDGTFHGNNSTGGAGGAMGFSTSSRVTVSGGTYSDNTAAYGGAVIIQGGADMTISGGTFANNQARKTGGTIHVSAPSASTGDGSKLTVAGGTIIGSKAYGSGGAVYVDKATVVMTGGTITDNKSGNAAGGIYINKGDMEMTGGTISKNRTANYGCGIYFMRATGKVTGGTITNNVSGKGGAGIYCYAGEVEIGGDVKITDNTSESGFGGGLGFTGECQARLTGGTVTGNDAGNAGGIIVQGQAHLTMTGGYVGGNTTRASGGGVYVNKSSADFYGGAITGNTSDKTGAGLFANNSATRFGGTAFTNNEATANGGAMYINKGKAAFHGGTYSSNRSERYGGGIYMNAAEVTMNAAKITGNYAKAGSGGMHAFGGKLTMEKNVLVAENMTDSAAGGLCVTKFCELILNGSVFEKNEADNGAGVLVRNWAEATLNDAIIRENVSFDGSGLYVLSNGKVTMNGGQVTGNISKTRVNKSGRIVGGNGAGVYVHTSTRTQTGQSTLFLNGVEISNNVAERIGGGVYLDMQMILHMDGCTIQNNQAGGYGAGIFQNSGTALTVKDTKILANSGTATGSALYAGSDLVLDGCTITGNKTTDGTAVYVAPARYDGHSYTNAVIKLGGDMQICDNKGTMEGDLYFDEGVAAAGTAEGFGKNTKIKIQLHSGVLTNAVLAAYNYEGGDRVYTITYGDRSLTEPEYVQTADSTEPGGGAVENALLCAGLGVFVLAAAAVLVRILLRKKKTHNTAAEASKE